MKLPSLSTIVAEKKGEQWVWACDQRPNAVLVTLGHVFSWRSTRWWKNTKALNMMVDPNNRTRWTHKRRWHNRGRVWDRLASEWAGAEDWTEKRKRCGSNMDMRDFVTFALMNVAQHPPYTCAVTAVQRQNGSTAILRWRRSTETNLAEFNEHDTGRGRGAMRTSPAKLGPPTFGDSEPPSLRLTGTHLQLAHVEARSLGKAWWPDQHVLSLMLTIKKCGSCTGQLAAVVGVVPRRARTRQEVWVKLGETGRGRKVEGHDRRHQEHGDVQSSTRLLGRQQKGKRMQWLWYRDQSCRQGKLDHNQ